MLKTILVWVLAACGFAAAEEGHRIVLRIQAPHLPAGVIPVMKRTAAEILASASVLIEWRDLPQATAPVPVGACMNRGLTEIDVVIAEQTPQGTRKGVLGRAWPHASAGARVRIYWDRIAATASVWSNWAEVGRIAGHALAHEVGHVLIGRVAHSESGLMSHRWTGLTVSSIGRQLLGLSSADAEEIRLNLASQRGTGPCQG